MTNISQSLIERLSHLEISLMKMDRLNGLYKEYGDSCLTDLINSERPLFHFSTGDLTFWESFEIHLAAVYTMIGITDDSVVKKYLINRCDNMSKLYKQIYAEFATYKDLCYKYFNIRTRKDELTSDFQEE